MTAVALENEDIALYPVYNDLYAVSYYGFDGMVVKSEKVLAGEYTLDYVLADENGKYFEGWKVEGTEETVTSVNVTANVNLYPVYTDKTESLETIEEQEMRFDSKNATAAIRFKSSITAAEKHEANEFGFIVTKKTYLDKMAELAASDNTLETELTFDFKYKGADLFVSNHFNAGGGDGFETFVYSEKRVDLGKIFAKHVKAAGQNLRSSSVAPGVKIRPGLYVLKNTNMTAVLNEGAFVDNLKDIQDWDEDHELKKLGIAYAKAVAEYLGLEKKVQPVNQYHVYYGTTIGPFSDKKTAHDLVAVLKAAGYVNVGVTESRG
jgi:hypothetical protein